MTSSVCAEQDLNVTLSSKNLFKCLFSYGTVPKREIPPAGPNKETNHFNVVEGLHCVLFFM